MNSADNIIINKRKIASASEAKFASQPLTLSERAIALTMDSILDRVRAAEARLNKGDE